MLTIAPELRALLPAELSFAEWMALRGDVYRELENRRTQRIVLPKTTFFIKQHFGIGWREIVKNLCQLRLPVTSAENEWRAIQFLQRLRIPTLEILGYGKQGFNPAKMKSFLVTRELPPHVSLEELTQSWRMNPPSVQFKRKLIREVARLAKTMLENGMNHRDFYICHLVLEKKLLENDLHDLTLRVIDLHRAQLRHTTPTRWVIKDLAGLYFSSKEIGLTQRDLLRFMKEYRQKPLKDIINKEANFWQKVKHRGDELYRKHTEG